MRICVFGNSITWGAYDREIGGWVERLKVYFYNKDLETDVYNYGISADKVKDILFRFDFQAALKKPDVIILAIGINDSARSSHPEGTPLEEFRRQYNELLGKAEKITKNILIVGPTNVDESIKDYDYKNEEIKKYDQTTREIAKERNLTFIDCFGILTKEDLSIDGLHPDANGHRKIFEKVKEALGF